MPPRGEVGAQLFDARLESAVAGGHAARAQHGYAQKGTFIRRCIAISWRHYHKQRCAVSRSLRSGDGSVTLLVGPVNTPDHSPSRPAALPVLIVVILVALSWLPLWCALLVGIRASDIADLREAASTAGNPTFPVAGGRRRER
jgi:hypothetical protein